MFTSSKTCPLVLLLTAVALGTGCNQEIIETVDGVANEPGEGSETQKGPGAPKVEVGTNLEDALAKAKESGKHVFVDFTGSDWCPPCMALHQKILTQTTFLEYAKKNLEMVILDFPRQKQQFAEQKAYNQGLAEKYKIEGFPTVVIFDGDGKEVHREVGFPDAGQPATYVAALKKALGQ